MPRTLKNQCTGKELMIIAAARQIKNKDIVFVGAGEHTKCAAYLAKNTHAPMANISFELGMIDTPSMNYIPSFGDPKLRQRSAKVCGTFYCLSLLQRGYVDIGLIGGAEVDKYGNVNSTVIGDYKKPKVRLPGSGGANDFASNLNRYLIMMPHGKRRIPERVSHITTPGFIDGSNARQKAGLRGSGPNLVVTDMAVFNFHPETKTMQLESIHPGYSVEDILANMGFEPIIPKEIPLTQPPTSKQLEILRSIMSSSPY
jgi:acyl CoA:acetate/3-ketoacid CoA transferase beta subunit